MFIKSANLDMDGTEQQMEFWSILREKLGSVFIYYYLCKELLEEFLENKHLKMSNRSPVILVRIWGPVTV